MKLKNSGATASQSVDTYWKGVKFGTDCQQEREWWNNDVKKLTCTMASMHDNKTRPIWNLFYGKSQKTENGLRPSRFGTNLYICFRFSGVTATQEALVIMVEFPETSL